jgi:hypothetical protein
LEHLDLSVSLKLKGMKMEVTAESTSYNSVSKSFKLLDVIKQVVKSISGLDVNAPFIGMTAICC